jgi:hypothetical protein
VAGLPDCWDQFRVRDRGQAGLAAVRLALVTVLQRAEKLTGRLAAGAVRMRLDWKYLLGLAVDDPGFDHAVLAEFRGKVAGAGLERGRSGGTPSGRGTSCTSPGPATPSRGAAAPATTRPAAAATRRAARPRRSRT